MWILPKPLHTLLSASDTEGLILDLKEQSEMCAQSLFRKLSPSPARTWLASWKRDSWSQLLSGRILKPSHGKSFTAAWTSCQGAFPANLFHPQENEQEMKTPVTSSPTSSMASLDLDSLDLFSLKTWKESSVLNLLEPAGTIPRAPRFCSMSLESWRDWVTTQRREDSQRLKCGAPHQRKRVFILGVRDGLRESGRDLISSMLERGREPSVGNSESWDGSRPLWGRKPKLEGVQLSLRESGTAYPATRGAEQYTWEPRRTTMGDSNSSTTTKRQRRDSRIFSKSVKQKKADWMPGASHTFRSRGEVEPKMGRDIDGPADWLDYAELSESCDSRIDELRMLGNGVVPDTASRAFRTLFARLA